MASLVLFVACLAWLSGKTLQIRKLGLQIWTLTWWKIPGRIRCSRHSIGRLPIGWSIRRNVSIQWYRLLASLGLVWPPGNALIGAIIMDGLLGHGPVRNSIAKDHTSKMSLEIIVSGRRLQCTRRVEDMALSRGEVDLRPCWQAGKVGVQRHGIWLSRNWIVAVWRGGYPLRRHYGQVNTRPPSRSVGCRACHGCCFVGKIPEICG